MPGAIIAQTIGLNQLNSPRALPGAVISQTFGLHRHFSPTG